MISTDPLVWIAAFLTLCAWSYYVRPTQNIFFRFAQTTIVGLSMGYIVALVMAKNIDALVISNLAAGNWIYIIPVILGLMTYLALVPKYNYLSRIPISVVMAAGLGIGARAALESEIFSQIHASTKLLVLNVNAFTAFNNIVILVGVVTAVFYFVFTLKPQQLKKYQYISKLGRYFLMIYFGTKFASVVNLRVSNFAGRLQFLILEWLGLG